MNICIDCRKYWCCPWSEADPETGKIRFEPVPGWTAEPSVISFETACGRRYDDTSYNITACPLFERDPPRRSDSAGMTLEQLKHWMRRNEEG